MNRKFERLSAIERMQINQAHKAHEGTRLLALFGAMGALPAGALVLGTESAPGAPLFCAALAALFAAYMFWGYTDAAYQVDNLGYFDKVEMKVVRKLAFKWQRGCFGYGFVSIGSTLAGFAGVYSNLRLPVGVSSGFLLLFPLATVAAFHVLRASTDRNHLLQRTREAGERLAAELDGAEHQQLEQSPRS